MFVAPQHDRFLLAAVLTIGCVATGLGYAVFGPRTWVGRAVSVGVGVLLVCVGLGLFLPNQLPAAVAVGVPLALVAGVGVVRLGRWAGLILNPLLRPRVGGLVVVAAALGWGIYEARRYDQMVDAEADAVWADLSSKEAPQTALAPACASTDDGNQVILHEVVDPWSPEESLRRDRTASSVLQFSDKWIRRGPATDASNCHGWVFTGGKYNVGGQQVLVILRDNDYEEVKTPEAGDLCVYRDKSGVISHSAIVRASLDDGTVLVEGKWGRLGVYLHGVGDSCYGENYTYYRSGREGHLLQGVEPDTVPGH